jgi:hypothetical protein
MPKTITTSPVMSDGALRAALTKIQGYVVDGIFNSGGLAIGSGSKKKIKVANTVYAYVDGVFVTKTTEELTLTTACNVTAAKFNVIIVSMSSAGVLTATPGTEGATLAAVVAGTPPTGNVVLGFVIINPTGTGNFVGGTTDLDDATVIPGAIYVNTVFPFNPAALAL